MKNECWSRKLKNKWSHHYIVFGSATYMNELLIKVLSYSLAPALKMDNAFHLNVKKKAFTFKHKGWKMRGLIFLTICFSSNFAYRELLLLQCILLREIPFELYTTHFFTRNENVLIFYYSKLIYQYTVIGINLTASNYFHKNINYFIMYSKL